MSTKDDEVLKRKVQGASNEAERQELERAKRYLRQALEDPSWPDKKAGKLYAMTKRALERLVFRGEMAGEVPGGHEVADFIQQAILNAWENDTPWDPKISTLLTYLWTIIKNHIKDCLKRSENKRELRETTNSDEANAKGVDLSQVADAEDLNEELEEWEDAEKFLEKWRDDRDFSIIKIIVEGGVEKPKEIAGLLGISVREVNNAKKRLRSNKVLRALHAQNESKKKLERDKAIKKRTEKAAKKRTKKKAVKKKSARERPVRKKRRNNK